MQVYPKREVGEAFQGHIHLFLVLKLQVNLRRYVLPEMEKLLTD